jgi:hypothetical protein
MSPEVQLAFPSHADNPDVGERAGIEAAVLAQERDRAREAFRSRPCRCPRPAGEITCLWCGREPIGRAA